MLYMCNQKHFLWEKKNETLNHFVILFAETYSVLILCVKGSKEWNYPQCCILEGKYKNNPPPPQPLFCNKMTRSKLFLTTNSCWFELVDGFDAKKKFNKCALAMIQVLCTYLTKSCSECGYCCVLRSWFVCNVRGICFWQLCSGTKSY